MNMSATEKRVFPRTNWLVSLRAVEGTTFVTLQRITVHPPLPGRKHYLSYCQSSLYYRPPIKLKLAFAFKEGTSPDSKYSWLLHFIGLTFLRWTSIALIVESCIINQLCSPLSLELLHYSSTIYSTLQTLSYSCVGVQPTIVFNLLHVNFEVHFSRLLHLAGADICSELYSS